jgi:hypothetical protein
VTNGGGAAATAAATAKGRNGNVIAGHGRRSSTFQRRDVISKYRVLPKSTHLQDADQMIHLEWRIRKATEPLRRWLGMHVGRE